MKTEQSSPRLERIWKEAVKVDFLLFIAEPLSRHKTSVQLTALFGLVQPAVPRVEPKRLQKIRKKDGGGEATKSPEAIDLFYDANTCPVSYWLLCDCCT